MVFSLQIRCFVVIKLGWVAAPSRVVQVSWGLVNNWRERGTGKWQIGTASALMDVLICCGEPRAEYKSKVFDLPADLHSYTHLWRQAPSNDWKNKIADTRGKNKWSVAGLSLRDSSVIQKALKVKPWLLHITLSQLRWWHLIRTLPGRGVMDIFHQADILR